MSFRHAITFVCNSCDTEHIIEEEMEMPPNWFGFQIAIANDEGVIPDEERDVYMHFCSRTCLIEYAGGQDLRERAILVDKPPEDEGE